MRTILYSDYYVYEWFIVKTLEVFYVGKGRKMRRFATNRNRLFNNIYNKYECTVRLVKSGLTEQEAFRLEQDRIAELKPRANLTLGGEGVTGYRHTLKSKKKMSNSRKGKPCPWNKRKRLESTNKKLKEIRKKQKPPRVRPVVIFDSYGNVFAEFKSVRNMIKSNWLKQYFTIYKLLHSLKTGEQFEGFYVQYI